MDDAKLDAAVETLRKAFHRTRLTRDVSVDANALGDVLDYFSTARRPEPEISLDGPNKIGQHRKWLARQLLDSRLTDDEAYGIAAYFPR